MKTLRIIFTVFSFLYLIPNAFATTLKPVSRVSDTQQIISQYGQYLEFVIEIGKNTSYPMTKKLEANFAALLKSNPDLAADFLKGLRFEFEQKREMVVSAESFSTQNASIRQWVTRFIPNWEQESEEYVFRASTQSLSKK